MCTHGYDSCTAAVNAIASKGYTSCGFFPHIEDSCCLSCYKLKSSNASSTSSCSANSSGRRILDVFSFLFVYST